MNTVSKTSARLMFALALTSLFVTSATAAKKTESSEKAESSKLTMKPYSVKLTDTELSFDMVPIPGGVFTMGSPDGEADREDDEGPQHKVKIEPFWMGKHEVTWDEYDAFRLCIDKQRRDLAKKTATKTDKVADAVTRPTKEYRDMTFEMGHDGFPAICMTQLAAKMYCEWLSAKTGQYYRLPTEAEWEYACRAGTTTAYSFGDDADKLEEYAWFYDNADEKYHKVGEKKPNPWGLYDMHGNVAEWCLDGYEEGFYKKFEDVKVAEFPATLNPPKTLYSRIVRGGSWDDDPDRLRSAARSQSDETWKVRDPQLPQSMWWNTDSLHVGFRIVRPLKKESEEVRKKLVIVPDPPKELMKDTALTTICE